MTAPEMEELIDLLLLFFESLDTSDGEMRDKVSQVRHAVVQMLDEEYP